MKIKFIILVAIVIALIMIFNNASREEEKISFDPLELELGQEFTALKSDKAKYVLNYSISDVTGDTVNDVIIVVGEKMDEGKYTNFDVVVYDTDSEKIYKAINKKTASKVTKIESKDLTGDDLNDIIFICENEDKTLSVNVAAYKEGGFKEIFSERENEGVSVSGAFLDGFKADINLKTFGKKSTYDLKENKQNYITSGFYAENGKLLSKNMTIRASKFAEVEFVMLSNSYGLRTKQFIKGFDNLDILDEIQVLWKYENNKWIPCEAMSTKLGNLLY